MIYKNIIWNCSENFMNINGMLLDDLQGYYPKAIKLYSVNFANVSWMYIDEIQSYYPKNSHEFISIYFWDFLRVL